jgi:hypothetical protein
MLSIKRMSYQLFQLRFSFLQRAFDLSSIMVDVELLFIFVFISDLPKQSSTYLPAYLGHSFIFDIPNFLSLTVDSTLNNGTMSCQECGDGNGFWDETVLLQVALTERGVFCFGNAAVLVWMMIMIMIHYLSHK